MKLNLSLILSLLLSLIPLQVIAADEIVEKTECVQAFGYPDLGELKADLLLGAKRLAVDDLFGFLIVSSSAVQQSVLTDDAISISSVGYVRVKGIPDYSHGDSLAEVCVTIQAYVTEKDRMKFDPITITADECVTDPDLSPRKLEDLGEEQTIIKALVEMNAKLQDQDRDSLLKLVRNVKFSEASKIMSNTDTYCGNVTAEVVPIEIEAFLAVSSYEGAGGQASTSKPCDEWNLASDFRIFPNQENPNRDSCGNLNVWHFMSSLSMERNVDSYSLLPEFITDSLGVVGVLRWRNLNAQYAGFWVDTRRQANSRPVEAHTDPEKLMIIGWRSPLNGRFQVTGSVMDGEPICGDGVRWFIDKGEIELAVGTIASGGRQDFQKGLGGNQLANIEMEEGDYIYLLIHPTSNYECDGVVMNLTISRLKS